jgi:hypothetical protein
LDADPGGVKRAKKEGKNSSKRHKKDKKQCNWYSIKWVNVNLFSLKVYFSFVLNFF